MRPPAAGAAAGAAAASVAARHANRSPGSRQAKEARPHGAGDQLEVGPSGSDETLLAGLASGDTDREAAFVRSFQGRVYGLACRLVGETALAEDVAQEAFIRAWRHAAEFDPHRGSVATWLLTITRNLAIDALRRRKAVPVNLDLLVLEPDRRAKQPDELASDAHTVSRLRAAIRHLPPEQRRAVVLASFYGQTAGEISMREGVPLGTAKTRIRLGIAKLRAALDGEQIRS